MNTDCIETCDCLDGMRNLPENSIDLIVTDPPYGISFMGKDWDKAVPSIDVWKECLRVLKSGAFAFIMSSPRIDVLSQMAIRLEKAGFNIGFTPIYWAYACLSEDTEILTESGWEQLNNTNKYINKEILIYDVENDKFKWEIPERWNIFEIAEEVFRIKSNETDQLVSKNHRVFTERGFVCAKELQEQESVAYLPMLPEEVLDIPSMVTERKQLRSLLFNQLPSESEHSEISFSEWKTYTSHVGKTETTTENSHDGREELGVEGGCDLFQEKRQLQKCEICKMPQGIYQNGSEGWLCDGTPINSCEIFEPMPFTNRGCPSFRPRCNEQFNRKSDTLLLKQRPQTTRTWKGYSTTLATVTKEQYEGLVFCPTVSTGCFVARRNGKIFLTGNSGFPKAMNIGKAVDKRLGMKREVVGVKITGNAKQNTNKTGEFANGSKKNQGTREIEMTSPKSSQAQTLDGSYAGFQPKPAVEVIIVAMKPLSEKTYVDQALSNGKGVTWLDNARIPFQNESDKAKAETGLINDDRSQGFGRNGVYGTAVFEPNDVSEQGRFPANLLVSDDVLNDGRVSKSSKISSLGGFGISENDYGNNSKDIDYERGYSDSGSFSRYFSLDKWADKTFPFLIVPKASRGEKNRGLDGFEEKQMYKCDGSGNSLEIFGSTDGGRLARKNFHPTVKPLKLMSYLITLGSRPNDIILDPFIGSGTTAVSAKMLGRRYIGFEKNEEYAKIANARLGSVQDNIGKFIENTQRRQ